MQIQQVTKNEILYNLISTCIFLGVVVALPLFLFFSTPSIIFWNYGGAPLLLGLWTFLREPGSIIKHRKMESLSIKYPDLENQIITFPAYISLKNPPEILYFPSNLPEVFAFGTWKKRYIAISEGAITNWSSQTAKVSLLTHELAHIANGDTWKTGFATHFLYWIFGISIFDAIRSFPYSMFFKIHDSFRGDNGIADLVTASTILTLSFAVLLAIRFLYRIKEYLADMFTKRHVELLEYANTVALLAINKPRIVTREQNLLRQGRLFKALGFHPNLQARLSVLQFPDLLENELASLLFVIGMFLGYVSGYFLDLDTSFATIISGEIAIGFIFAALMVIIMRNVKNNTLKAINTLLKPIINLANGTAIAFIFLVGINNLLVAQPDGKMNFRQGVDLIDALFCTLDVLLLLMIIVPILILGFAFFLEILTQNSFRKHSFVGQILFVTVSFFPSIYFASFYVTQWWKGEVINLIIFWFLFIANVFWILFTFLTWRIIPRQKNLAMKGN